MASLNEAFSVRALISADGFPVLATGSQLGRCSPKGRSCPALAQPPQGTAGPAGHPRAALPQQGTETSPSHLPSGVPSSNPLRLCLALSTTGVFSANDGDAEKRKTRHESINDTF